MEIKQVLEALLFASQKPLSLKEISTVLKSALEANPEDAVTVEMGKTKPAEIEKALDALRNEYAGQERSFMLVEQASGWQVVSRPDYSGWVRQLYPENRPTRLSAPALETLAIIAYRQPITRADLEAVRGVSVDGVMQTLLDRGLIRIAGRADVPGRPLLYDTTQSFLEHFGLKDLDQLPNSDELKQVKLPTAATAEEPKENQLELGQQDGEPAANTDDNEGSNADADVIPEDATSQEDEAANPVESDSEEETAEPEDAGSPGLNEPDEADKETAGSEISEPTEQEKEGGS